MASLHRRSNGRWKVAYRDPDGGQRSKTFRTKRDAERFHVHVEEAIERGTWRDPHDGKQRFEAIAEVWFAEKQAQTKPGTASNYRSILDRHILPTFADKELGRITQTQVRQWVAELRTGGLGATSLAKAYRLLGQILAVAVEDGVIAASPMPRHNAPATPQAPEQRYLSPEEIDDLADALDPLYRRWLYVMVHTGMRWSEAAGLCVRRVDLLRRKIDIAEQLVDVGGTLIVQPPKTDNGRRHVTVPKFIADMLAEQIAGKGRDDLVFTTAHDTPLRKANFRKRVWLPALEQSGLAGLRVHDLRHTHVALLIAQGEKPLAISRRIGHFDVAFTLSRYGHLLHDEDEEIAARMEQYAPQPNRSRPSIVALTSSKSG